MKIHALVFSFAAAAAAALAQNKSDSDPFAEATALREEMTTGWVRLTR